MQKESFIQALFFISEKQRHHSLKWEEALLLGALVLTRWTQSGSLFGASSVKRMGLYAGFTSTFQTPCSFYLNSHFLQFCPPGLPHVFILSFSAVARLDFPAPPATLDWTPPGSSPLLFLSTTEPQDSLSQLICLANSSKSPFLVGIFLPWHRALHSPSFSCSLTMVIMNYGCVPNTPSLSPLYPAKWEVSSLLSRLTGFIFVFGEEGWDGSIVHISPRWCDPTVNR